jgi:hypothetical protein
MNQQDERIRGAIHDALTQANIDARNLSIEVKGGAVDIKGSVPTDDERGRVAPTAAAAAPDATSCRINVGVLPVAPSDADDGRGRSPLTGTSADSAHESKHQTDP